MNEVTRDTLLLVTNLYAHDETLKKSGYFFSKILENDKNESI